MVQASTTIHRSAAIRLLAVAIGLILLASPSLRAQDDLTSPADLRREIDQLKERVAELEAELEESNRRAESLMRENLRLKRDLAKLRDQPPETGPGTPPDSGKTGQPAGETPPDDALASPDSLFHALVESYEREFGGRAIDDPDERSYVRDVSRWARQQSREFRDQIDWVITVVELVDDSRGTKVLRFRVVNPMSGRPYGEMIGEVRVASRLLRPIEADNTQKYWSLAGVLTATPNVNSSRPDVGLFNTPRLIGPFAEFEYELNVQSIEPAEINLP